MANGYDFTATVAPGASATKGLVWLTTTSTVDATLVELEVSMDGGTVFVPKFNIILWTGAFTAPTGGNTLTINKATAAGQARSAVTTGKFGTFTAEPSGGTSVTRRAFYFTNQGLPYPQQWPLQREPLYIPLSAALLIQAVTPASFANNITVNGVLEE